MNTAELTSKFQFKKFVIHQNDKVMKVCTDSCLLGALAEPLDATKIIDIGTGTGLLSLMMAQKSDAIIDAVDIDEEAVRIARHNVAQTNYKDRVLVFHDDIQNFAMKYSGEYDFVISNPPFYSSQFPSTQAQKNIHRHSFLLNQTQLLQSVYRLIKKPNGKLWLLLPPAETEHFERLASQLKLFPQLKYFIRDRIGSPIIRVVTCFGFERSYLMSDEVVIRNKDGEYTFPTKQLLERYYLHF